MRAISTIISTIVKAFKNRAFEGMMKFNMGNETVSAN